jgi:hypothetical protein
MRYTFGNIVVKINKTGFKIRPKYLIVLVRKTGFEVVREEIQNSLIYRLFLQFQITEITEIIEIVSKKKGTKTTQ